MQLLVKLKSGTEYVFPQQSILYFFYNKNDQFCVVFLNTKETSSTRFSDVIEVSYE